MNNQRIVGIGCYAKPEKLCRIFKRMVKDYTLGQVEEFELLDEHEPTGKMLLRTLITGQTDDFPRQRSNNGDVLGKNEITGFFLSLRNQRLNLSIFSKGSSHGSEIYMANLDELTKIRQKRLN